MKPESIVAYLDEYLQLEGHPDYSAAFNGLQVEGTREVRRIAAAVDASLASVEEAAERGADLMLVHHGLFWSGAAPVTGPLFRRMRVLIENGLALYSAHLPLDAHPEVGNCALLSRAIGVEPKEPFGRYQGAPVGWRGELDGPIGVAELEARVASAVSGPVRVIPGGPGLVTRVGVVTGGGASFLGEAARLGLHALVTGEGPHHTYIDAMELGVHVLLGGHYATETFGVKALAELVSERFGVDWFFVDQPTGL